MAKVFSIVDFKEGLDVRKTPLTAPGGSLRILENAVINNGGEIEKRLAFAFMTQVPSPNPCFMYGHGTDLHVFGWDAVLIPPMSGSVPIVYHQLVSGSIPVGDRLQEITDVEPFGDKFFVTTVAPATTYCWYNDVPVHEADGSFSHGYYARAWRSKMYRLDGPYLRFSGVNNPAQNDPTSVTEPGAGFINLSLNDPDAEALTSMEVFNNNMAILAQLQTQIYSLDPDPSKDTLQQLIRVGCVCFRSTVQFGTGDVLFLSDSGVRSLRAQSFTTAAGVTDVGSAIDPLLIPIVRAAVPGVVRQADAIVQPISGRYWLGIGDTIYVLSYFPAGHITAWSTFKPGFSIRCFAVVQNNIFVMDLANNIYLYGGVSKDQYDPTTKVTVRTPHMNADRPTENKRIQSVDVMCQGTWTVDIGMLPNNTDAFERVATVDGNTYGLQSIPFAGYGTHFGVHMENQAPGPAVMAALHLNLQEGVVK